VPPSAAPTPPPDADRRPRLSGAGTGRRRPKLTPSSSRNWTPEQRLLILDTWQRSGLSGGDFAELVDASKHTLYSWKRRFDREGPAGLVDRPAGARPGSRLPDITKRAILLLKQTHPTFGCERISDLLARGPALPAGPDAVARVLREAGYEIAEVPTKPHPDHVRTFERPTPSQLWQTDLFTFILKRQNRRVWLVAFLDDHSRFIVSYGLHASASTALVLEVLRAGIASYGPPQEILTDNGTQYVTWRGKSAFSKELEARGIRQVVAAPRHPQTLGKIERVWGTLWRECLQAALFLDLEDARRRIGHFIDYYNFQRTHEGIGGLVPADRFFGAAPEILRQMKERVAANALDLAKNGVPRKPFYLTGQVGGHPFSLHAEGERLIVTRAEGGREEIALVPPGSAPAPAPEIPEPICPHGAPLAGIAETESPDPRPPGTSSLDEGLGQIRESDLSSEARSAKGESKGGDA
jgi:transposase InsO family protein